MATKRYIGEEVSGMRVTHIEKGLYTLTCISCEAKRLVTPKEFWNVERATKVGCPKCRIGRWGSKFSTPEQAMHYKYLKGAEYRGIAFEITFEEFLSVLSDECHYCGGPGIPRLNTSKTESIRYCGLDRVDSGKGYSVKNCVPCCKVCNRAKSNMSYQDFVEWMSDLVKFRQGKQ